MIALTAILLAGSLAQASGGGILSPAEVDARREELRAEGPARPPQFKFAKPAAAASAPPLPDWLRMEKGWNYGARCGPNALYVLMALSGHGRSLDDVSRLVEVDPTRGSSLEDLARAAGQLGFKAEARRVAGEDLARLPAPFLMHITQGESGSALGHYLVIFGRRAEDGKLGIVDGNTGQFYYADAARLLRSFDGYVLVPASSVDPLLVRGLRYAMYGVAALILGLVAYLGRAQSSRSAAPPSSRGLPMPRAAEVAP